MFSRFIVTFLLVVTGADATAIKGPEQAQICPASLDKRANVIDKLMKRIDDCGNGTSCTSFCCGNGCSYECCYLDNGGGEHLRLQNCSIMMLTHAKAAVN